MSQWVKTRESKKTFKFLILILVQKNFEFKAFKARGNDIWYIDSQSFLMRKLYFEVYYLAITCTGSLTHLPHKTGILVEFSLHS